MRSSRARRIRCEVRLAVQPRVPPARGPARQAILAEQAGFDVVTGADHFHPWVDDRSAASFVWTWFGAVAQATSRVELATSVTAPLFRYHPALIAQAAATVARLSGAVSASGWAPGGDQRIPSRVRLPRVGERIARMQEAIHIIQSLLAGEKLDFEGTYYVTRRTATGRPPWVWCGWRRAAPIRQPSPGCTPTA